MLATKNIQMSSLSSNRPLTAKGFQMNVGGQENAHLDAFLAAAHRRRYPAKSTLIYAGDKSDSIYYILKGSVTVLVEDESGKEIIVSYLNKGDFFGEMPLFTDDTPRSAWVKAKIECEVAELSYGKFKELADKHPELLYAVGRQMAESPIPGSSSPGPMVLANHRYARRSRRRQSVSMLPRPPLVRPPPRQSPQHPLPTST